MSKSKEISEKIAALRKEYLETAKTEFHNGAKELFEKYGDRLKSFAVIGYCPFFNDGDTCEYSAQSSEPEINGYGEYDDDDEEGFENLYINSEEEIYTDKSSKKIPNPNYSKEAKSIVDAVVEFTSTFDDEFYQGTFGDHAKIVVTPEGVTVEEYEHE